MDAHVDPYGATADEIIDTPFSGVQPSSLSRRGLDGFEADAPARQRLGNDDQ
jgi:hypothetical protein